MPDRPRTGSIFDDLPELEEPAAPVVATGTIFDDIGDEIAPPPPEVPQTSGADHLQNMAEEALRQNTSDALDRVRPHADDARAEAQLSTEFEDAPMPRTYPEALGASLERNGVEFRPDPEISDDIERLADRMAHMQLWEAGLWDDAGAVAGLTPELVEDLRGAHMYNMTVLYSDLSAEEVPRVMQRAVTRIGSTIEQSALSKINDLEARIAAAGSTISFGPEGTSVGAPAQELTRQLELARQDFAQAKELQSRAGEPKVHEWFSETLRSATRQSAMLAPPDTREFDEAQILNGLLDWPTKYGETGGDPHIPGRGELGQRFTGLLGRHLALRNETGRMSPFSLERATQLAFHGSLIEERTESLGVRPDLAETVSPTSMLVHTHPGLVGRLGRIAALNEGKKYAATNPDQFRPFDEIVQGWVEENGVSILDRFLASGVAPLQELRSDLDVTVRDGADALKDSLDVALGRVGAAAMAFSRGTVDAIGEAQGFYGDAIRGAISTGAEVTTPKFIQGSSALAFFGMAVEGMKAVDAALKETDEDAARITPEGNLWSHKNRWLSGVNQLSQMVLDTGFGGGPSRVRMGLTEEGARRVFNPTGNLLHQASLWLSDEFAAETLEKMAPFGFHPSVIREQTDQLKRGEFSKALDRSIVGGVSQEEFDRFAAAVSTKVREKGAAESWADLVGLGVMHLGKEFRATVEMLLNDPEDLAVIAATGAGAGFLGGKALGALKNQTFGRLSRTLTANRTLLALRGAIASSPDAVDNLAKVTRRLSQRSAKETTGVGIERQSAILESASNALNYLSKKRKEVLNSSDDLDASKGLRDYNTLVDSQSKRVTEILRHVDPRTTEEIFDWMQFDDITRGWVKNSGLLRTLRANVEAHFRGRAGNLRNLPLFSGRQRLLFDSIASDPSVNIGDLPISPEVVTTENLGLLQKMYPSRAPALEQAAAQQEAVKWIANYQKDTLAVRALGAENRARLADFTGYVRHEAVERLRGINLARKATRDPEVRATAEALRNREISKGLRARALRRELVDSGTPLDSTKARAAPLFEAYEPEDLIGYLAARDGDDAIYDRLRGSFESRDSFWERIRNLGRRFDGAEDAQSLTNDAAKLKSQIVKDFFEQPGLRDELRFDLKEGFISPGKLRRNIRERKRIGQAFLNDNIEKLRKRLPEADRPVLDEMLEEYADELDKLEAGDYSEFLEGGGFRTRQNLKSAWEEIRRNASTERANRFATVEGISGEARWGIMAEASAKVTDGRTRTAVADAQAYGLQTRILTRVWQEKFDNIQAALQRLSPDEQELFDVAAVIARDEGVSGPLRALRKKFPEYFEHLAPETDDIAVQRLWDEADGFRKTFLRDLADVGLIDAQQFRKLVGPYAPRLFSSTELPRLFGTDGLDLRLKPSPIRNVSIGELAAQRHISRVKAQVYPRGGRPVTQHFKNVEQAERWIANNYGIKGTKRVSVKEAGGVVGDTTQGSKFAILKPLGKEAQTLGADFIRPGTGMFIQMRNLVNDMMQIRYFNAFDRKGISFAEKDFLEFERMNPRKAQEYELMPESKRLGSLSGKYVHRGALNHLKNYSDFSDISGAISDAVENRVWVNASDVSTMIDDAPNQLKRLSTYQKAAITYNLIARNPATIVGNFLSDTLLFSRLAGGSEMNFTLRGWTLAKDAWRTIRDVRSGKVLISDLPDDLRKGLELGVVDESLFSSSGLANTRRQADLEAIFGKKTPLDVILSPLGDPAVKKALTRQTEIDRLIRGGDLSDRVQRRLSRERAALNKITRTLHGPMAKALATAGDFFKAGIGAFRGRAGDIPSASATFYGDLGNLNRLRTYLYLVREKGLSPEAASGRVNRFMQTYSHVGTTAIGRQLQRFSKTALGSPIVSFPYELIRIGMNTVRHNPGAMAGIVGAAAGRNFAAIAASGTDPYRALKEVGVTDNPLSLLALTGNQIVPLPGGKLMTVSNPAFNLYSQLTNNFGTVNGLAAAWDDAGDDTLLSKTIRGGIGVVTNFAFTNPLLNSALSVMSKTDPLTGRPTREGEEVVSGAIQRFMQPMIHPLFPVWGSTSEKLMAGRDAFPHAYTGRMHSILNKGIQALTGMRVRGDVAAFLEALPPSLEDPLKDAALRGTKLLAWLQLWESVPEQRILGEAEGLGWDDYFASVVASSSYLDPQNGHDLAGAQELSINKLRTGLQLREDPASRERGDKMVDEAIERLTELRSTNPSQLSGFGRDATKREIKNLVARVLSMGEGYETALDSMSVLRRTGVVLRMMKTLDAPDEMKENLFRQWAFTKTWSLRGPANVEEIAQTRAALTAALTQEPLNEKDRRRVAEMIQLSEGWEAVAEAKEMIRTMKVEELQRADQVLREVRGE